MYGIICNARKGKGIRFLALVDRARSKRFWWTSDNANIALCYEKKEAAEFAARRLKKNKPQVVPFFRVLSILNEQRERRSDLEERWRQDEVARDSEDPSWDAHKDNF